MIKVPNQRAYSVLIVMEMVRIVLLVNYHFGVILMFETRCFVDILGSLIMFYEPEIVSDINKHLMILFYFFFSFLFSVSP